MKNNYNQKFNELYEIIKILRAPNGCPWDRNQTPFSIKENLIEESYECVEAIIDNDNEHVKEELGDVFLMVTFLSIIYEEESFFTLNDIFDEVCNKLVRRHPHVFGNSKAKDAKEVLHQWEEIKDKIEGRNKMLSVMDSIPNNYPPLLTAFKMQKKAEKKGFDWTNIEDVFNKLEEEKKELKNAIREKNEANMEEEIGDLLFTVVNLSRFLDIDPSTALMKTNKKFKNRFKYIEKELKKEEIDISNTKLGKLEELWNQAKKEKL